MALLLALRPRGTRLFVAMLAGWGVVTFALPALDWALAERLGRQPFQFNLVRNLRYLDVWLLAILALLVRASRRKGRQRLRTGVQITAGRTALAVRARPEAAALAAAALALLCYAPSALRTASSLAAQIGASRATLLGRWRAVPSARLEALQAVQAFRRERETVLTPQDLEFFRQLRIPLVYTWKDPETLSYAAGAELALATRVVRRERALLEPPVDLADALALSTETGAGLLVVERWRTTLPLRESPFRLFQNDRYVVLRPPSPAPPPPPVAGGSPGGPASP